MKLAQRAGSTSARRALVVRSTSSSSQLHRVNGVLLTHSLQLVGKCFSWRKMFFQKYKIWNWKWPTLEKLEILSIRISHTENLQLTVGKCQLPAPTFLTTGTLQLQYCHNSQDVSLYDFWSNKCTTNRTWVEFGLTCTLMLAASHTNECPLELTARLRRANRSLTAN